MRWFWIGLVVAVLVWPVMAQTETSTTSEEETHHALRALRDDLVAAFNKKDIDGMLRHLHANVVYVPMNAETLRGKASVRAFLQRMLRGPDRVVKDVQVRVEVDALTTLYGDDTGVASGSSHDRYTLASGKVIDVAGRWTCTLVQEDSRWHIASVQHSVNMFDNPIVDGVQRMASWAVIVAGALGALLSYVVMRLRRRRQVA